jgi:hypothetical protein
MDTIECVESIASINSEFLSGYKFMLISDLSILGSENVDCSKKWFYGLKDIYEIDNKEDIKYKLSSIKNSKIIFIKRDFVEYFINKFYNYLQNDVTLISHCSDIPVINTEILDLPKIKKWYAMNTMIKHPKLITIPIGLTTHEKKHGDIKLFKSIIDKNNRKKNLIYINFNIDTNRNIRFPIMELMKLKGFKTIEGNKPLNQKEYWNELSSYKFCISPPGNGVDCHRIWECLYFGTIPIVMKNKALEQFYHLKILFIDDWNVITKQFLEEKYIEFENKEFDNSMCYYNYWKNEIK